jgi:hypothetical protein
VVVEEAPKSKRSTRQKPKKVEEKAPANEGEVEYATPPLKVSSQTDLALSPNPRYDEEEMEDAESSSSDDAGKEEDSDFEPGAEPEDVEEENESEGASENEEEDAKEEEE